MKRLLFALLASLVLPAAVNADHDRNHNDEPYCVITSEYSPDYRIEMYWPTQGLLFYKDEKRYSIKFNRSNGYSTEYFKIQIYNGSSGGFWPTWNNWIMHEGSTGDVVVFVGDIPLKAYWQMSDKEREEVKFEDQGRVLFVDLAQSFHYLPDFEGRTELYAERDGEWFKVAHNFWSLGEGCNIDVPKYF